MNNRFEENRENARRGFEDRQRRNPGGPRPRKDPMDAMFRDLNSLLAPVLAQCAPTGGPGLSIFDFNPEAFTPLSETFHEGDDLVLRVELPGVTAENISVELNNNRILITGEKKAVFPEGAEKKLQEIRYGKFSRVYPVPTQVSADAITADFKEGILEVRVRDAFKKATGVKINIAE